MPHEATKLAQGATNSASQQSHLCKVNFLAVNESRDTTHPKPKPADKEDTFWDKTEDYSDTYMKTMCETVV